VGSRVVNGHRFVEYDEKYLDPRGGGGKSKAQIIFDFLVENADRAWYSVDLVEALKDRGVKIADIMANVRRWEKKRLVYVRGYKTDEGQTPFRKGYLITYLDGEKSNDDALEEAIERSQEALEGMASSSPVMERVHRVRDIILEHSQLRKLVSFTYIDNELNCTPYQADHAVERTLQLYPDLTEIKLFDAYRYYYQSNLSPEDLLAAIEMKKNYVRLTKGRANRIGHNWEAVAEWFIDIFTYGAKFWKQDHRTKGMDPRRITLHLLRGVGKRRRSAEVDRVWEVTPGPLLQPTTYVLSCKWSIIRKSDVDDFMKVLRWSKEFGVNTPDGRQVRQSVVGVFAGSAFKPNERVQLKDGSKISLASYAARMNIQLLKSADFNEKLRDRGCEKSITVQRVCRIAHDENEVRRIMTQLWETPNDSKQALFQSEMKNKKIYEFEKWLETE